MTPLDEANAKIMGLEAAISHLRRTECKQQSTLYRTIANGHLARAYNEDIKERFYECENQHEPLADVVEGQPQEDALREEILKVLHYVVFGR